MSDDDKVVSLGSAREKKSDKEEAIEKEVSQEQDKMADDAVYCSFCKRPNHMCIKMIKGPDVNICSECVMICIQYLILQGDERVTQEAQKVMDIFWSEAKK